MGICMHLIFVVITGRFSPLPSIFEGKSESVAGQRGGSMGVDDLLRRSRKNSTFPVFDNEHACK